MGNIVYSLNFINFINAKSYVEVKISSKSNKKYVFPLSLYEWSNIIIIQLTNQIFEIEEFIRTTLTLLFDNCPSITMTIFYSFMIHRRIKMPLLFYNISLIGNSEMDGNIFKTYLSV